MHDWTNFYPRPPRGGRPNSVCIPPKSRQFLSTSPARGTTPDRYHRFQNQLYFYPRPPRGGRLDADSRQHAHCDISIHVPHEGDDSPSTVMVAVPLVFLSTSPARGTTEDCEAVGIVTIISIHVPREGDDGSTPASIRLTAYFYPRPPRGGRLCGGDIDVPTTRISIHVPREGDDRARVHCGHAEKIFLSTSPARGTTLLCRDCHARRHDFYPRPPRGGRHPKTAGQPGLDLISIHVPREGDDSKCDGKYIAFSCNICHNKIQRTKTRCIFVQNATVSAAYLHKYPKNDNRPPVRTVRCFSAHCRLAPAPCRPQRAFLHRCLYTNKISSCAHCGARPTCSTLVLYWLPSR